MQLTKLHTTVTSAFSHVSLDHFLSNMSVLRAFVSGVVRDLGCRRFAYFYIASAYASKLFDGFIFSRSIQQPGHSLGASGVLSAVVTFRCLTYPHSTFLFGKLELSLEAPLAAFVWALDDALLLDSGDGIGHGAHLGGALFGAITYSIRMLLRAESRTRIFKWIGDAARSSREKSQMLKALKVGVIKAVLAKIDENEIELAVRIKDN